MREENTRKAQPKGIYEKWYCQVIRNAGAQGICEHGEEEMDGTDEF